MYTTFQADNSSGWSWHASSSSLVLADEPTGSLDSRNRISALKDCGKTVIVVSHDDKFREISDNVIFLRP